MTSFIRLVKFLSQTYFTSYLYLLLDDLMSSLRGEVWAHKTSLTLPLFIKVPITSQESAQSRICICELEVSILLLSTILELF